MALPARAPLLTILLAVTDHVSRVPPLAATLSLALLCTGCPILDWLHSFRPRPPAAEPEDLVVQVLRSYPHDRDTFTQGLLWHRGKIYESGGLVGRSSLRRVDLDSGQVEAEVRLPAPLFAEGLARSGDRLIQLTWKDNRAFVWRLADLAALGEHAYDGEGWGLCELHLADHRLVMSDGTNRLTFRDADDFTVIDKVEVMAKGAPVTHLNELECVGGAVYANVWLTDRIVRIDPRSGAVTAWIDASNLLTPGEREGADVLNGIAYLPEHGTFLLTGKLWPRSFEVKFVARTAPVSAPVPPSR